MDEMSAVNALSAIISNLISLAITVLVVVSFCLIFKKMGKPWWAALIPIYNIWVFLEAVGKPWWWILLLLVPLVNIVIMVLMAHELSKAFGQGIGFTIGIILLSFIFLPLLAFGKNYTYQKAA